MQNTPQPPSELDDVIKSQILGKEVTGIMIGLGVIKMQLGKDIVLVVNATLNRLHINIVKMVKLQEESRMVQ